MTASILQAEELSLDVVPPAKEADGKMQAIFADLYEALSAET